MTVQPTPTHPPQDTAKPIGQAGGASCKTYLRDGKNTTLAEEGGGKVRNCRGNTKVREGQEGEQEEEEEEREEVEVHQVLEKTSTLQLVEYHMPEQMDIPKRNCSLWAVHTGNYFLLKECNLWRGLTLERG